MKKLRSLYLILLFSNLTFGQDKNISNGLVFEGEPYLAINPTNSQNLVVAWMGYIFANAPRLSIKIKSSFDGGKSWTPIVIMPHLVSTYKSADVSLAFDQNNNLFMTFIDYRESPDSGGIYIFKSTNGGLNWGTPKQIIDMYADGQKKPIDRPFIVINETGDKLYLTSKPPSWVAAPNRPYFSCSIDSGKTWKPWRFVDTANFLVGPSIAAPFAPPACSGNKFSCVYPSYVSSQNVIPQYIIATSTDNGNHFTYNKVFSGVNTIQNDSAKLSYRLLQNPVNLNHQVFIFPFSQTTDLDIYLTETFDAGITWTSPIRMNDDATGNGKMQDLIWADFDNDGDLAVSWRDRRNALGIGYNKASEYYACYRSKDSSNFSPNFKLSDSLVNFNNILIQNGNDFMGMELENDTISAVWGNTRDGSLDIWFSRISAKTGQLSLINLIESESPFIQIFPNPSSSKFEIQLSNNYSFEKYELINSKGELLSSSKITEKHFFIDLTNYDQGIYFVKFYNSNTSFTAKISKN